MFLITPNTKENSLKQEKISLSSISFWKEWGCAIEGLQTPAWAQEILIGPCDVDLPYVLLWKSKGVLESKIHVRLWFWVQLHLVKADFFQFF